MFKINQIVWDSENKEYVRLSNGIPIVEGKPEIKPTEAIAMRVIGIRSGKPIIGYTHRKVNADKLSLLQSNPSFWDEVMEKPLRV